MAYGAITVETTGQNYPLLTGALCSICISAIVCAAVRPGHTCALTRLTSHYIISASFPGFYIGRQAVRRPGMLQEAVIVCIACCCTHGIPQSTLLMNEASLILSRHQAYFAHAGERDLVRAAV